MRAYLYSIGMFLKCLNDLSHARIQKVLSKGVQFYNCGVFFDDGSNDPNSTKKNIIDPPAKRQLNGVRWRADDGPILNSGLVAL